MYIIARELEVACDREIANNGISHSEFTQRRGTLPKPSADIRAPINGCAQVLPSLNGLSQVKHDIVDGLQIHSRTASSGHGVANPNSHTLKRF